MLEIPQCTPAEDDEKIVEKAVADVIRQLNKNGENAQYKRAQINTCHCATGGYKMSIIRKVGHMFASKGYWVYLVTGGAYNSPSWMDIQNYEGREGYTSARFPSFYERIR